MIVDSHLLEYRSVDLDRHHKDRKLKMSAKRYRPDAYSTHEPSALTLLLTHGSSHHKEHWEPTLDRLFSLRVPVRGAWAFDWQGHGESADANEGVLGPDEVISNNTWGRAIADFVRHACLEGPLVAIGHSSGGTALMCSTKFFPLSAQPYTAIILVEPPMIHKDVFDANVDDRTKNIARLRDAALSARAWWDDKADALRYLSVTAPWSMWDPRIRAIYVEHGFKPTRDRDGGGVERKCPAARDAGVVTDYTSTFDAADQIGVVSPSVQIHFVFGGRRSFVPRYGQDVLVERCRPKPGSVVRIDGVGHLILQEVPDKLADVLDDILRNIVAGRAPVPTSKL